MNPTARRVNPPSPTRPPASRPPRGRRRRSGRAGSGRRGRKDRGPLFGGLAALVALVVAAALALNWTASESSDAADSAAGDTRPSSPASDRLPQPSGNTASTGGSTDKESGSGASGEKTGTGPDETDDRPSNSPSPSSSPDVPSFPASGPGTFTTAGGGSGTVGKGGRTLRYKVVVEDGLDQSAADVARQVEGILADPRGWTADGRSGFRRVSSGATDFVVRLATPGTVDDICGQYGLNTRGEVNCNVGDDVVVNLKRWLLATPVYAADVDGYRALIINHEVGHFLGHGHVTCPGAGKPAPAMMQQIKGMRGCTPNVWPYDTKGRFVTGPAVS